MSNLAKWLRALCIHILSNNGNAKQSYLVSISGYDGCAGTWKTTILIVMLVRAEESKNSF